MSCLIRQPQRREGRNQTYVELIPNLGVGFQFSIQRSVAMTPDESTMLRLDGIVPSHFWIGDME